MTAKSSSVDWKKAVSWAFYDFANTIYSAIIVSFAIALHVKEFTGVEKWTFIASSSSMLVSGLFVPFAGEMADRTGSAKRYLVIFTLLCCACCAAISWAFWAPLILLLYFCANFFYNSSLAVYDSLLPVVAPRKKFGLISGLGVGLGYAGIAVAMPLAILLLNYYQQFDPAHELRFHFLLTAVLYLLFSVPLFLFVPERETTKPRLPLRQVLRFVWKRTMVTIRGLPRHKNVLYFMLGNFLCVDAFNATIFAYAPYVENVLGMDRQEIMIWMVVFGVVALVMGVIGGRLSDYFGSRPTLLSAAASAGLAIVICSLVTRKYVFLPVFIVMGGYGLSTIWVAGRKLLLTLAPPGQVGKYFGLYNVGHKLSIIGIFLFGMLADLDIPAIPAGGYRAGLLVQVVAMAAGAILIWKVKVHDATG